MGHKKALTFINALYVGDVDFLLNSCISAVYKIIDCCNK